MPLEETIDSLEGIDEKYKDLYVENDDGKFEINIDGLKSALTKERNTKKELEKKLKSLNKNNKDLTVEEMEKELTNAKNTINDMIITGKIKEGAISAGVDPEYVDDVLVITKNKFKLDESGEVICVDKDGTPTGKDVGSFFVNDFKRSKPRYFVSSGRTGSGSHGTDIVPTTVEGRIQKAIKNKDVSSLIKLKQSKINK